MSTSEPLVWHVVEVGLFETEWPDCQTCVDHYGEATLQQAVQVHDSFAFTWARRYLDTYHQTGHRDG